MVTRKEDTPQRVANRKYEEKNREKLADMGWCLSFCCCFFFSSLSGMLIQEAYLCRWGKL